MSKNYLLTRPEHDDTTHYLSNYCKQTIKFAENKGMKVFDLHQKKANKKEFEGIIKNNDIKFIVFNGHGSENVVTGHDNKPIVSAGVNEQLLKSKTIYAISCQSAKVLGQKSVEKGATSYTGYNDDFIFFYEPTKISRPLQDETAKMFLDPTVLFIDSMIKGNTVETSVEKTKKVMQDNMVKLLGSNTEDASMARYLWWNLKNFVSRGDQKSTI